MSILLFVVLAIVILVLLEYALSIKRLRETGAPYMLGYPLFHRQLIFALNIDRMYDKVIEEFPKNSLVQAFRRGFFGPIMFISADPDVNKYILERPYEYIKGSFQTESLDPLLGDGIFNANGKLWLNQRKTASFMFAKRELKQMISIFVKHFTHLEQRLAPGEKVEIQHLTASYTLDCFLDLCFGIESNSLINDSPFANAFNVAQSASVNRLVWFPYWKWLPSFLLPFEAKIRDSVKVLDDQIFSLIQARKNDPDLSLREDLLSRYLMMQKEQQESGVRTGEDQVELTDRYLRDVTLNFILAGRDTTAQSIMWAMYLLSLPENEGVRDRVYEESKSIEGTITYNALKSSMSYTERFIYEVLRLYPPVPSDPKSAAVDDVLPGGYKVQQGDMVMWSQNVMGRLPHCWHEPLRVLPDRWLGAEHNGGIEPKIWSGGFIPFQNGGRRNCLGQEMALLEIKSTLCMMGRSGMYFDVVPGQDIRRYPNITISARKPGIFLQRRK